MQMEKHQLDVEKGTSTSPSTINTTEDAKINRLVVQHQWEFRFQQMPLEQQDLQPDLAGIKIKRETAELGGEGNQSAAIH